MLYTEVDISIATLAERDEFISSAERPRSDAMAPSSRFVRAAMAVAACLAPQAAGYTLSLTPRTRCSTTLARPNLRTPLVVAAASDVRSADEEACLVLPHEDYPGQAPETIMGEMSLKVLFAPHQLAHDLRAPLRYGSLC
eukprot:6211941-Pleurochrysis_carterae.AAC.4